MNRSEAESAVLLDLQRLRAKIKQLSGSVVATCDGFLVAHDLAAPCEPDSMAALAATELSLSRRLVGDLDEIVIHGPSGYAVIYSAGPAASLLVLAAPSVNLGRLHLETRPFARSIAAHLTDFTQPRKERWNDHVQPGDGSQRDDVDRRSLGRRRR